MSLIDIIKEAGIVGAGGAGFPTHIKLNTKAEYFIVNAAECEPLIETDKYLCRTFADELIKGVRNIVGRKEVENSSVFLNDITSRSFLIQTDYFTAPVTIAEFNTIRQEINLQILKLMEELHIEIAGANTDVRITKE